MSDFHFFPERVVWEITFACNMRCIHCGTSAGVPRSDELTTDEALRLIDELTGLGARGITLSGGEPLLRKDWPVLGKRIVANGAGAYLITNGFAVDEQAVDLFQEVGLRNVGVSFDGSKEVHNYIRQRKTSYDKALHAMRLMAERKMRFEAVSQISKVNLKDMDSIHKDLVSIGCPEWRIQMTTVTGRMEKEMVMGLAEYEQLIDKILEFKKDTRMMVDVGENIGYYGCKGTQLLDGMPYLGCYAGVRVAGICSNGDVKGCLSQQPEFVEGNIRERSFTEIWNDPTKFLYNREFTKATATGACHDCRYLPLCRGGCTTTSVSASGERANNPFCIWQVEQKRGVQPIENDLIVELLSRFQEPQPAEKK
ncbi:MAG TPA: radical SAM protein [candidate division Zixibacteria bacterium]|nr:radical SAM protein [candidate division Zixibacteria bacterium]